MRREARREGWRRSCAPAAIATLVLGLALCRAADAPALAAQELRAPAFENVTLVVGGYQVFARYAGELEAPVTVLAELWRDGALMARDQQTSSPAGDLELAFASTGPRARRPVVLRSGDELRLSVLNEVEDQDDATGSPPPATYTAGRIEATVQPDATIVGQAPPGQRVTLTAANAAGRFGSGSAVADEQGRWSVDLAARLTVGPGTTGTALYVEDGIVHQTSWAWRNVHLRVGDPVVEIVDRAGAQLRVEIHRHGGGTAEQPIRDYGLVGRGVGVVWRGGGETTALLARDSSGAAVAPRPGDIVFVYELDGPPSTGSGSPIPDEATEIHIDEAMVHVDPQQSIVTGRMVTTRGPWHLSAGSETVLVEPEDDGSWSVDLSALPLRPDTTVLLEDRTKGWSLIAHARAVLGIDPLETTVFGRGVADDPVALRVLRPTAPPAGSSAREVGMEEVAAVTGLVDPDGTWRLTAVDQTDTPLPLTPDTQLEIEILGARLRVPAPPVIARARASRDLVQGEAPPDSVVTVEVDPDAATGRAAVREQLVVGASGRWRLGLEGRADLVPGTPLTVHVWPPGGLPAELRFPVFRANVQSGGDRVRIEGWPGLRSTARLERDGTLLAVAECVVTRTPCDALWQALDGGPPPRPSEGDEVLIYPEREAAVTLPVVKLAAHIDLSGADVVGASPPREPVEITFRHDEGRATPLEARIGADDNGVFDYELAASQWDLVTPGLIADVYHPRPGGHRLFASGVMESVRAWPGQSHVSGVAEPGTRVSASLHAPVARSAQHAGPAPTLGPLLATGETTADGLARFTLTLRDAHGQEIVAQPGSTMVVTHARRSLHLPIEHLAAWPLDDSGALAGAAPPLRPLRAIHHSTSDPSEDNTVHLEAHSDLSGTFAFPAPPTRSPTPRAIEVALELGDGAELRRRLAAGDDSPGLWLPYGAR